MSDTTMTPRDEDPRRSDLEDDARESLDTEGHSLLQAELHRAIAVSRSREAAEWARAEQARKQQKRR